jgi:hypothetical protein
MNLIDHKVDIKKIISLHKHQKRKWRNSLISIFLFVFIFSGFAIFSAEKNVAEANLFEVSEDFQLIIDQNNKIADAVPVPIESITINQAGGDKRVLALMIFLERYKSPMANANIAKTFVEQADKNGFGDKWQILPAISGIESGFGRITPRKNNIASYNAWGWTSKGSKFSRWAYFNSWEDAVTTISKGLAKGYGPTNLIPERMMRAYCPDCHEGDGKWAVYVSQYIDQMNVIYESLQ